jgi:hypothetical protein
MGTELSNACWGGVRLAARPRGAGALFVSQRVGGSCRMSHGLTDRFWVAVTTSGLFASRDYEFHEMGGDDGRHGSRSWLVYPGAGTGKRILTGRVGRLYSHRCRAAGKTQPS